MPCHCHGMTLGNVNLICVSQLPPEQTEYEEHGIGQGLNQIAKDKYSFV